MRKIKPEDIKIGDFIYIIEHLFEQENRNRRFILKILSKEGLKKYNIYFWKLENTSKKASIFDPLGYKGNYSMLEVDWEHYKTYRLDKEIAKFKKLLIINNL